MASFLDKFKITTGIDTNTKLDLSCQHVTTADWMQLNPVYIKEMVPGETLKVHQETFSRMAPLEVPTFGRGLIHNRAFFVPMRTIYKDWDKFITDTQVGKGQVSGSNGIVSPSSDVLVPYKVPTLTNDDLLRLFLGDSAGAFIGTATSGSLGSNDYVHEVLKTGSAVLVGNYDIAFVKYGAMGDGTVYYFNLTNYGRRVLKILESLGYKIVWASYDWSLTGSAVTTAISNVQAHIGNLPEYSALPLYAFWKIILDWYYPSQYVGDSLWSMVDALFTAGGYSSSYPTPRIDYRGLHSIYDLARGSNYNPLKGLVNYDSDYFVSAFDSPTGSVFGFNSNSNTSITINDINHTNTTGDTVTVDNGSDVAGPVAQLKARNGSSLTKITQYGLDSLKAVTDYMKRHQLVGARALDRFYARFGKSLSAEKLNRSLYLGADNIPLQFGDVMSHANTYDQTQGGIGSQIGAYKGKGIAYGANGNFECTTDEYGYFIIASSIVPVVGYYQGIDRTVLHTGRTDFWTPEFDQLGNQAISKLEVCVPMNGRKDTNATGNVVSVFYDSSYPMTGVFGYTPRYSEYKLGRDRMTGDWRYGSINTVGDTSSSWHLFRNVGMNAATSADLIHTDEFVSGADAGQFGRIFQYYNEEYAMGDDGTVFVSDPFYMIHTFNVVSESPMHSLYDTYKFENEDEGAKTVVADVNGVKVN